MTMFTNGYSSLQMPEDFEPIATKDEFNDLYLVNTKLPMSIKFSTTPTLVGLPEIMDGIEQNLKNNERIEIVNSGFITINEQIYYMIVSSFNDGETQIRRMSSSMLRTTTYTSSNSLILMQIGNWMIFI